MENSSKDNANVMNLGEQNPVLNNVLYLYVGGQRIWDSNNCSSSSSFPNIPHLFLRKRVTCSYNNKHDNIQHFLVVAGALWWIQVTKHIELI